MHDPIFIGSLVPIAGTAMVVLIVWFDTQRKTKQSFYRSELLRKIAESQGEAADKVLEMMRQEEAEARIKRREGLKLGGLITSAAGLGVMGVLAMLVPNYPTWIVGLIPLLIGAALVLYVVLIAPKPDREGNLLR
jgi:hypothetical protein